MNPLIMNEIEKLKTTFPKFNILYSSPKVNTVTPYGNIMTISYQYKNKIGEFIFGNYIVFNPNDNFDDILIKINTLKIEMKKGNYIIKYGEDYEKLIKNKWLKRKLPEKGIKIKGNKI